MDKPRVSMGAYQISETLENVGHNTVVVSELINILAQQSPMMPIIGFDEDNSQPKYLNGIRVDESGDAPVFIIYFSEYPKKNQDLYRDATHDERVAEQHNKALDMAKASRDHMRMLE